MALDVNSDGHVDFKELCCGVSAACRGPIAERIKFCFKIFDIDQDGFLNSKELHHMIDILLFIARETKIFEASNRSAFSTLEYNKKSIKAETAPLATQETGFESDNEKHKKAIEYLRRKLSGSECLSQEDFLIWGVDDNSLISPLLQLLFEVCHVSLGLKPHCRHHEYEIGKTSNLHLKLF